MTEKAFLYLKTISTKLFGVDDFLNTPAILSPMGFEFGDRLPVVLGLDGRWRDLPLIEGTYLGLCAEMSIDDECTAACAVIIGLRPIDNMPIGSVLPHLSDFSDWEIIFDKYNKRFTLPVEESILGYVSRLSAAVVGQKLIERSMI